MERGAALGTHELDHQGWWGCLCVPPPSDCALCWRGGGGGGAPGALTDTHCTSDSPRDGPPWSPSERRGLASIPKNLNSDSAESPGDCPSCCNEHGVVATRRGARSKRKIPHSEPLPLAQPPVADVAMPVPSHMLSVAAFFTLLSRHLAGYSPQLAPFGRWSLAHSAHPCTVMYRDEVLRTPAQRQHHAPALSRLEIRTGRPFSVWMVAPVDMPTSSGATASSKSYRCSTAVSTATASMKAN